MYNQQLDILHFMHFIFSYIYNIEQIGE